MSSLSMSLVLQVQHNIVVGSFSAAAYQRTSSRVEGAIETVGTNNNYKIPNVSE